MKSFKNYILESQYNRAAHIKKSYDNLFTAMTGKNSSKKNYYANPDENHRPSIMTNYYEGFDSETDHDNPETNKIKWNNYNDAMHKVIGVNHLNEMLGTGQQSEEHLGQIWSSHAQMLDDLTQNKLHSQYDKKITSAYRTIRNKFGHTDDEINTELLNRLAKPHSAYFNAILPKNKPSNIKSIESIIGHHVRTSKVHHDNAYLEPFHPSFQHPDFDKNAPMVEEQK